jgi:hypothetical protein
MSQVAEWEERFSSPMLDPQRWIASYMPASSSRTAIALANTQVGITVPCPALVRTAMSPVG